MVSKLDLEVIDDKKMFEVYDKWPEIAKQSYNSDLHPIDFEKINHIVFAGMGGSGAIGDIFSSILSKSKIHVNVVKGYLLPHTTNSDSLIVTTSISGNTKETLEILRASKELGCKIIAFSDGGLMKDFCEKNSIEHRQIKMHHSPRASFTVFLYSMLNVLRNSLSIKNEDIEESLIKLKEIQIKISSKNLSKSNPSLMLAEWITEIPLIYFPYGLQSAAIRFKNSLQENSKIHVIVEDIVESCHNGIVAWEKKSSIRPIFIKGVNDHIKSKEKFNILAKYFDQNKIEYKEINSLEGSILTKIICLIYLLDYSTIYKAIIDKTDPSPVNSIDFVKKKMK